MNTLEMLGAEEQTEHLWWHPLAASAAAGAFGALVWRSHPVLACLLGLSLGRNTYGVVVKERTWQEAVRKFGQHITATAGALALPKHPVVGYLAGAVAGDVLIDGKGGGLLDQWARSLKKDVPSTSTALVATKDQ